MWKNIYDGVTNSVDAWQYFGIGAAILVLAMYLAKVYFSVYPPKSHSYVKSKDVQEYHSTDIQQWLNNEKENLKQWTVYKKVCEVEYDSQKKCLILIANQDIAVEVFFTFLNYVVVNSYGLLITLAPNKFALDTEVTKFRKKSKIPKAGSSFFYNYHSNQFHVGTVSKHFECKKISVIRTYDF